MQIPLCRTPFYADLLQEIPFMPIFFTRSLLRLLSIMPPGQLSFSF